MPHSLITGGAGFIGSTLADELLRSGDRVTVLDDLSTGRRDNLSAAMDAGLELHVGSVADFDFVNGVFERAAPDRVFHLAAQASVRRAVEEPAEDARSNVLGTINVLEAARRSGSPGIVFAATGGAVYGEGKDRELPFTEEAEARPETPYGAGKLAGEVYLDLYRRAHGIPTLALRLANVYGPRQDPHGEAGVMAIFCGRVATGERPLIFGDGKQTRDYVFVDDVVAAMVAAQDRLQRPDLPRGPLNIGTGREASVLDLVEMLATVAGREIEPEFAPARAGEVERVCLDAARARGELGWEPRVTLEEGLRLTLEHRLAGA